MKFSSAVVAMAVVLTLVPAVSAQAADDDVLVVLASDGQGLHIQDVGIKPSAGVAGDVIGIRVASSTPEVTSTQPDPAGDGARFAISELGWVPTNAPTRLRVSDDGADAIDMTLPPHTLTFGEAPNTVRGRTLPNTEVAVSITAGGVTARRTVTTDAAGRFAANGSSGAETSLPARWQFGTEARVVVTGTVDGNNVALAMTRALGTAKVNLREGDDLITITAPAATIDAFGRTTRSGRTRSDTAAIESGTPVTIDGAAIELDADPLADVTSWDPDTQVASGTATPGAQVNVTLDIYAENFTGGSNMFTFVDDDGTWSVTFGVPTSFGPFTGATLDVSDPKPSADGATYSRTRSFGTIPESRSSPEESDSEDGRSSRQDFVPTFTRSLHVDTQPRLRVSSLAGEGLTHVFTATTADDVEHVATIDGVAFFSVGATATPQDFTPPLDLRTAFDLVVDRGGEESSARFETFDLTYDPTITGFTGTIGPDQDISLRSDVPGWAHNDAETATSTSAADGSVLVALGVAAPGVTPTVTVGSLETGETEGGFSVTQPTRVPVGSDGGTAALGLDIMATVAPGGPADTTLELRRADASPAAPGPEAQVRTAGDGRRVPAASTTVAITMAVGGAISDGEAVDITSASTVGNRTFTTRVPSTPILCLDPDDLAAACTANIPTPYAVVEDVPIGGNYLVVPRTSTPLEVVRSAGDNRIATAVEISKTTFPVASFFGISFVDDIIIANSGNFPDALAAAPLANAVTAPVLLNPAGALDPLVAAEIRRLDPSRVFIMGGPVAISEDVEQAVAALGVGSVIRFAGEDRYETAALAAAEAVSTWRADGDDTAGTGVLVALGAHPTNQNRAWPDALAAGPLAANSRQPILLTRQDGVPDATAQALDDLGVSRVTVLGGPVAIPNDTATALGEGRDLDRIGGDDRYHTSTLLADEAWAWGGSRQGIWVATGASFPDGLAASAAAATAGHMLVLAPPGDLAVAPALVDWLDDRNLDAERLLIAGGPVAISENVEAQLQQRLE